MTPAGRTEQRREAIRKTLARRHGQDADAGAIAAATLDLWREVAACLTPLIGARGVDALFRRALQLTIQALPWLGLASEGGVGAGPLAGFTARLEACDPPAAAEASAALLATCAELLAAMIGPSLTGRLLDPVWGPPAPGSEQETAS
jgi:hypothetical protein